LKSTLLFAVCMVAVCGNVFAQERTAQERLNQENAPKRARFLTRPLKRSGSGFSSRATVASIPTWNSTVVANGQTYSYEMVGQNPATSNTTTTISAPVIPLILTFSDGTVFDPTATGTTCSSKSAESLLEASPVFNNYAYTVGGTNVGTTTYNDFFQRANFWQYTQPTGVSPNFHLLLSTSSGTPVNITVPAADGATFTVGCGKRGEVSYPWLVSYLETTGFAQLFSNGVTPSQLPVFLLYNVAMYESTTSNCCVAGFHASFDNANYSNAVQDYVVADFDTTGYFTLSDVEAFTHEIGEWMDDPLGTNPTPPWGNVGQVTGCQTNLEVGDPLSGTAITVTGTNAYTYHLQELAFLGWFYRQSPSGAVNGWFSSNDTFKSAAGPCDPTTTTLSISPTTLAVGAAATVKVTVAPSSGTGTPTGTVSLVSGSTTLDTYPLASGAANETVTNLPAGSYSVTANYSGDTSFDSSSSSAVTVTVGAPGVTFSPVSLAFGSSNIGTTTAAQSVKLTNSGTAPLTGVTVSLTGGSPGDFSQTNNCGTTVAVGSSCTISVAFKPTATGSRTASVSVADNGSGSPQTVALSGTGVGVPAISFSPASLSFASTTVGVASAAQTVTVKNTGSASLSLTSINVTGTNSGSFTDTTTCTSSLAVNATCTIAVTFKPTTAGSLSASITVGDNVTGSPQTIALSGTGVAALPAITFSPASLSFG